MNVADVGHKEGLPERRQNKSGLPGTVATMPQTGAEQELQSAPWVCLEMEQQN